MYEPKTTEAFIARNENSGNIEIVSYQRFGRMDRRITNTQLFKCHLCGFCTNVKDLLLKHFGEKHPS